MSDTIRPTRVVEGNATPHAERHDAVASIEARGLADTWAVRREVKHAPRPWPGALSSADPVTDDRYEGRAPCSSPAFSVLGHRMLVDCGEGLKPGAFPSRCPTRARTGGGLTPEPTDPAPSRFRASIGPAADNVSTLADAGAGTDDPGRNRQLRPRRAIHWGGLVRRDPQARTTVFACAPTPCTSHPGAHSVAPSRRRSDPARDRGHRTSPVRGGDVVVIRDQRNDRHPARPVALARRPAPDHFMTHIALWEAPADEARKPSGVITSHRRRSTRHPRQPATDAEQDHSKIAETSARAFEVDHSLRPIARRQDRQTHP